MKKLLWTSAMALTDVACLTACDDSSSGASNSIPTYKTESALPDTCEMEVAKVDTAYFACFENKWVEVTDSATVEKIKEGLDEDDLKEELEDMMAKLSSSSKKPSSSSKKVQSSDDEGDVEIESSSAEEECTGRRCKTGGSSSSKKSSGGNGGSGSGEGGEGGESSSPSSVSSSTGSSPSSAESSSPSSAGTSSPSSSAGTSSPSSSAGTSSPSSSATSVASTAKCGTATYNPETHFCRPRDNAVIAIADAGCCDDGRTCRYFTYTDYPNTYFDKNKEFCDSRDYRIYKYVTIGTQTWMAENLNYETAGGSYCYDDDTDNCTEYGRLYDWDVAVNTTSPVCPTGWKVPSASDYNTLLAYIKEDSGSDRTNYMLRSTTGWDKYEGSDENGNNQYGFNLKPAGDRMYGEYESLGKTAYHVVTDGTYTYFLSTQSRSDAYMYTWTTTTFARSVRCIKD